MRILVVEDDTNLNRQIKEALIENGYAVDVAFDGEEGHYLGDTEPYDAVVLDIGLPQMDGLSVLEEWRRAGRTMPVVLLTARDRWSDKVQGIDAGADDYVAKPFHMEELLARLRALVRRAAGHASNEITAGPVRLDVKAGKVTVDGQAIKLTSQLGESKWIQMSERIAQIMREQKGLNANVDFYSATVYYSLGIPTDLFTPIFAIARMSGWTAHVLEQWSENRLFRPLSAYVGKPYGQKVVPIDER